MLTPLFDNILFVFLDDTKNGLFHEETEWGFKLGATPDNSTGQGRWGKVIVAGPDVPAEHVMSGSYVFIEPLMWTKGIQHDGVNIWKTDYSKIMLVSEDIPA